MLNAEEVIVGKTVGARYVVSFDCSLPVPHHHVKDGDRSTDSHQGSDQGQRQQTPGRVIPIHQHPIEVVTSDLLYRVSYVNRCLPTGAATAPSQEPIQISAGFTSASTVGSGDPAARSSGSFVQFS
jgi:hypothetical protein